MPSQFDLLVRDLIKLQDRRDRARQQQQAARARRRHAELMKAIAAPPADFSDIRRQQARLRKAIAADRERRRRAQCAATIAKLDQAARRGRLTGAQAGKLDALRGRFGAMTTPRPSPYPKRAA